MLAAGLLLVIAILSGALLSFLYDRSAPFPARLCMGAATGLVLLAAAGFLFALRLGLGLVTLSLSAAVVSLPLLLLQRRGLRERITNTVSSAFRAAAATARKPDRATIACFVFYGCMAVLLSAVFARAVYQTP